MKKIQLILSILLIFLYPVPIKAAPVSNWTQLDTQVAAGDNNITLTTDISAAGSDTAINSTIAGTQITLTANQFISGPGGTESVFNNSSTSFIITGAANSYITNNGSSAAAIINSNTLYIDNMQVIGGISQTTGGTLTSVQSGTVTLSGTTTNFSAGILNMTNSSVILTGGTSYITGGNIEVFNGGTLDISSNGGSNTANTLQVQNGDLILRGTNLTASAVAIGTGSGPNTVTLTTDSSNNPSSLTMNAGNVGSFFGVTLNIGSASSTGNSFNVAGGAINNNTTVNLFDNNNLNISGTGLAYLTSGSTWAGTANVSGGSLNVYGVTSNGILTQSSGTTTLLDGTTLNLPTGSSVTGGNLYIGTGATTAPDSVTADASMITSGATVGMTGVDSANKARLNLNYSSASSGTTFDQNVNMLGNSEVNLNIASGLTVTNTSLSNLTNLLTGNTLIKSGAGTFNLNSTGGTTIGPYALDVSQGLFNVTDPTSVAFSGATTVSGTLQTNSAATNFNSGLTLTGGILNILNQGFNVTGNLTNTGGTINTINNVLATNNISGNLAVSGTTNYAIDIDGVNSTSDRYVVGGNITGPGTINISNFNLTTVPTTDTVPFNVFTGSSINPNVSFTSTAQPYVSPIKTYTLTSLGLGNYQLTSTGQFNPQVFRGQVATVAAYANQLTVNNILFDHVDLVIQQLLCGDSVNRPAYENIVFAPYQYDTKHGGIWTKGFANLEKLNLNQDIDTPNNLWGSLIGSDLPIVRLKNGWGLLRTVYGGYTGAHQNFSNVSMYQNGGQGGVMATLYNCKFFSSLLANVGGYGNSMTLNGVNDNTKNWFAGAASRSAYNFRVSKDVVLQPTALVSYNAFGQQNWNSDYGNIDMSAFMLNGFNLAPGLNLMAFKKDWSAYLTTMAMFNVINGSKGKAAGVDIPEVKMGTMYFLYGAGVTRRIKDRFLVYGQVVVSNVVRTGVLLQGGLVWVF